MMNVIGAPIRWGFFCDKASSRVQCNIMEFEHAVAGRIAALKLDWQR